MVVKQALLLPNQTRQSCSRNDHSTHSLCSYMTYKECYPKLPSIFFLIKKTL
ncbi:hypothetical protein JD844_027928 [Phrynosoma platyrhinos]|uniref:Uncharacterized protein n=1 Tax=Phrynosoma platyrhinos TaxID=52577 RepID=A0ABQ7SH86_PHRPL|nr:hypothetical protein JD844_027928 [Phrynosoma platyrhinos]